jgi:methyl-accepting chemotaxis protein
MNIKLIPIILVSAFVVTAIIITAHFTIKMAEFQTQRVLNDNIQSHLTAIRDTKKAQIEDYFKRLSNQIQLYAHLRDIKEAMRGFKETFPQFQHEAAAAPLASDDTVTPTVPIAQYRQNLANYYNNDFAQEYNTLNVSQVPDLKPILLQLNENSIALQYHYIAANPNPLGTQAELFAASDASSYTRLHRIYHNPIKQLKKTAEASDILLVDSDTGMIVYSTNKELDFATSLIEGAYAKTGLGQVFRQANAREEVALVDFSPYLPAYNNQRAFIGTAIFDGAQKMGVLIFQMAIDSINDIMTYGKAWRFEESGLTGETYIVAADGTMRNDSRLLVEDKEEYLLAIEQAELSNDVISSIELKNTSVGLQIVDNPGTKATLAGKREFALYVDYHDEFVFSAYAPLEVPGLQWAVFSTLQENEALIPLEELIDKVTAGAMQIVGIVLLVGLIGLVLALPSKRAVVTGTKPQVGTEMPTHQASVPKTYTLEQIVEHLNKLR